MNKKWAVKRMTINLTSSESEKLERYCAITGRPATDVIRELIRSLEVTHLQASEHSTAMKTTSITHVPQPASIG